MADRVVMRFTPRAMELYDKGIAHSKECAHCGPFVRKSPDDAMFVMHAYGCLTGVLITQEWVEEYARLHNAKERQALSDFGKSVGIPDLDWGSARG